MATVLCVGVASLDTIVLVDKYPAADERVIALDTIRAAGGPAMTAAVTLARLGVEVALSCVIGDDEPGRFILETLKREGIDSKNVIIDPKTSTAIGTIVVSKSEETRAIMARPHNTLPTKPANTSEYQWIHVDHFGVRALKNWGIRRGDGTRIAIDLGYPVPGISPADFDLYVPSEKITTDVSTAPVHTGGTQLNGTASLEYVGSPATAEAFIKYGSGYSAYPTITLSGAAGSGDGAAAYFTGSKTSKSETDSPVPTNLIGISNSRSTASAIPPRALPSNLVTINPVTATASLKIFA